MRVYMDETRSCFTCLPNNLTQSLPTFEDGFQYIYIGYIVTADYFDLVDSHPIYEYKNGSIRLYQRNINATDITNGVIWIEHGGTGLSSASVNAILVGTATNSAN